MTAFLVDLNTDLGPQRVVILAENIASAAQITLEMVAACKYFDLLSIISVQQVGMTPESFLETFKVKKVA